MDIKSVCAVVTGGGSGIGLAITKLLCRLDKKELLLFVPVIPTPSPCHTHPFPLATSFLNRFDSVFLSYTFYVRLTLEFGKHNNLLHV